MHGKHHAERDEYAPIEVRYAEIIGLELHHTTFGMRLEFSRTAGNRI